MPRPSPELARAGELGDSPWLGLLEAAGTAGEDAADVTRERFNTLIEQAGDGDATAKRLRREAEEAGKRATRRGRTDALDAGLALIGGWLRDLAAVADGAAEMALTSDREAELRADAGDLDPAPGTPGRRAGHGYAQAPFRQRQRGAGPGGALFPGGIRAARGLSEWIAATAPRRFILMSGPIAQTSPRPRRPFGVRLYLAFAFTGVALITAGLAYLLVSESGQDAADAQLDEIAAGRLVAAHRPARRSARRGEPTRCSG